jgi:cytochrome P450
LARAQSEVDEVWGEGDPTFEQVAKLRYVRRAFDEALRFWPPVPGYGREAREDTLLGGRYPSRAGENMIALIPALHRDPSIWGADADHYDPDRFLPAAVKARPAHSYKPWGTGERACIGRQFALHEAVLVLGMLLRRYNLHADPAYRLKVTEMITFRPAGFTLRVSRRRVRPRL